MYPGDTDCFGVGKIDVDRASAWLDVRYQKLKYKDGGLCLAYDWVGIVESLVLRFFLLMFLIAVVGLVFRIVRKLILKVTH